VEKISGVIFVESIPLVRVSPSQLDDLEFQKRLLRDRQVLLVGPIDDALANQIIAQLLFLQMDDEKKPITLVIDSPGGSVTAGLAILDTMRFVKPDVRTHCFDQAHALAAILLAAGADGHRTASSRGSMSFSEPYSSGELTPDKEVFMRKLQERLFGEIQGCTGLSAEELRPLISSGRWLTALEAASLGIIDEVLPQDPRGAK
jgi:ATP-dependent Clp protease protease subunit